MKYRKKPLIVEATQWYPGTKIQGVEEKIIEGKIHGMCKTFNEKQILISPGEYVIIEVDGKYLYTCMPEIFERMFELM